MNQEPQKKARATDLTATYSHRLSLKSAWWTECGFLRWNQTWQHHMILFGGARRSSAVALVCQENILKPIKVRWPNLSCWGPHSIPRAPLLLLLLPPPPPAWNQLARRALALGALLPTHSARALNCLFNLTHNYCGNICVFCTSATACVATDCQVLTAPTAAIAARIPD